MVCSHGWCQGANLSASSSGFINHRPHWTATHETRQKLNYQWLQRKRIPIHTTQIKYMHLFTPLTSAFGKGCGPFYLSRHKDNTQNCAYGTHPEKNVVPVRIRTEARSNERTLRKFPSVRQNSHHELLTTTPQNKHRRQSSYGLYWGTGAFFGRVITKQIERHSYKQTHAENFEAEKNIS